LQQNHTSRPVTFSRSPADGHVECARQVWHLANIVRDCEWGGLAGRGKFGNARAYIAQDSRKI